MRAYAASAAHRPPSPPASRGFVRALHSGRGSEPRTRSVRRARPPTWSPSWRRSRTGQRGPRHQAGRPRRTGPGTPGRRRLRRPSRPKSCRSRSLISRSAPARFDEVAVGSAHIGVAGEQDPAEAQGPCNAGRALVRRRRDKQPFLPTATRERRWWQGHQPVPSQRSDRSYGAVPRAGRSSHRESVAAQPICGRYAYPRRSPRTLSRAGADPAELCDDVSVPVARRPPDAAALCEAAGHLACLARFWIHFGGRVALSVFPRRWCEFVATTRG